MYCYNGEWYNETKVEEIGLIQSSVYDDSTKCVESNKRKILFKFILHKLIEMACILVLFLKIKTSKFLTESK